MPLTGEHAVRKFQTRRLWEPNTVVRFEFRAPRVTGPRKVERKVDHEPPGISGLERTLLSNRRKRFSPQGGSPTVVWSVSVRARFRGGPAPH